MVNYEQELIARAIVNLSPRKNRPFVTLNCAAMPESLVESELFGHEKGSFTGANTRRIGRAEAADGGTLFLDEIGNMSATGRELGISPRMMHYRINKHGIKPEWYVLKS